MIWYLKRIHLYRSIMTIWSENSDKAPELVATKINSQINGWISFETVRQIKSREIWSNSLHASRIEIRRDQIFLRILKRYFQPRERWCCQASSNLFELSAPCPFPLLIVSCCCFCLLDWDKERDKGDSCLLTRPSSSSDP